MKERLSETTVDATPPRELLGFRALVTGGTRGIGAAISAALARRGANVVISARAPAHELPDGVQLVLADASTTEGAKHLAAEAEALLDEANGTLQAAATQRSVRHAPLPTGYPAALAPPDGPMVCAEVCAQ
jgi:NAD(P)-dependent dehydrogenase (short-subunit alcohol dehydrogenase family)